MAEGRRGELIAAARELLEEEGEAALSMRRLADRIGMRASSIFKHVPDKATLEVALVAEGLAEAGETLRQAGPGLEAMARAYREWALAHPHLYRLMTDRPLPGTACPPAWSIAPPSAVRAVLSARVALARMNSDDDALAFAGASTQARMVRRGEVSSRELVELYLRRIERFQPELNAFRRVMADRALADAGQADGRRGAGDERPLLGVPVAVKDSEDVAGEPTAWGTAAHGRPAERDNEFVSRLRAAGAVIIGKTNLPELAIMGDTEGPAFGVTRNPWNTDRSAGGSSGGSAAAVAAGLCAAATASDGLGSIRIPAANCGLVGLKPQRDRISLGPAGEHWYGLSVLGFNTRTVADTGLLLDATARDGGSYAEAAHEATGRLRIALSLKPPMPTKVDAEVKDSVRGVAEVLRGLGHEVIERDPAWGHAADTATVRYLSGIAQEADRFERPKRLQRRTRGFARLGRATQRLVGWARRAEAQHAARLNELFRDVDVLLTPVNARPPVPAGHWEGLSAERTLLGMALVHPFTGVWNVTGQPAISVPGPPSSEGLPIGAQLVGPADSEGRLLSLAGRLEAELGWPERRPPLS